MADVTVDEIKAVLTAEIGNLTAEMKRAADAIESLGKTATKSFSETGAKAIELNQALELAAKGFDFLKDTVGEAVKQAIDEEAAIAQLNATLQSTGRYTDGLSQALQELAENFQRTTTFSNDQALAVERLLVQYGAAPADIKPFTQAILDAAAGGKDLDTVTTAVAGAFSGRFTQAARLLKIQLDENASSTVNLAKIQEALTEQYGGRAAAALNTFGGGLKNAKNLYDDLLKSIGRSIIQSPDLVAALNDIRKALDSPEVQRFAKSIGQDLASAVSLGVSAVREGISIFEASEGALKGLALSATGLYIALVGLPAVIGAVNAALTLIAANPVVATLIGVTVAAETLAKKVDDLHKQIAQGAGDQAVFDQLAEGMQRARDAGIEFTPAMRAAVLAGTDVNVVLHNAATGAHAAGDALDPLADKTRKFADALSRQAQHAITEFNNEVKGLGAQATALGPLFDDSGARLDLFTKGLASLAKAGVPAGQAIDIVEGSLGKYEDLLSRDITSKLAIGLAQAAVEVGVFGKSFDLAASQASQVQTQLDRVTEAIAKFAAAGKGVPQELADEFGKLSAQIQALNLVSVQNQIAALTAVNLALGKSFETAGGEVSILEGALTKFEQQITGIKAALASGLVPANLVPALQAELSAATAAIGPLQDKLVGALGTDVANGIETNIRGLNIDLATLLAENTTVFKNEADQRVGIAAIEADAETAKAKDGVERRIALLIQEREAAGQNADDLIAARARIEDQITAVAQQAKDKRVAIAQQEVLAEQKAFANIGPDLAKGFADGIDKMIFEGGKLKDLFSSLKDFGIHEFEKLFEKTIENKLGILDSGFRTNLLTDLPNMFSSMADSVLGIFGKLWDGILGSKSSVLDAGLANGTAANGGTAGSIFGGISGTTVAGAAGAAGGGFLGSKLGGTPGAIVGSLLGSVVTSNAFSLLTSGTLTPTLSAIISKIAPSLATQLGSAIAPSVVQAVVGTTANTTGVLAAGAGPTVSEALANLGVTASSGTGVLAGGSAGSGAAAGGSSVASAAAIYAAAAIAIDQILQRTGALTSRSGTIRAAAGGLDTAIKPQGVVDFQNAISGNFDKLNLGTTVKNTVLDIVAPGVTGFLAGLNQLSSGQSSRRFLGNQILGNLSSISTIGSTLNFDPYKSGITSIDKAAAAYPALFETAGKAAKAFGTVLASSVNSGQSDAKELNFVVSTLIDNFGRAGVSGKDAIARIAGSFRELHIDVGQAAAQLTSQFTEAIQKAQQSGDTQKALDLQQQLADSLAGLNQVAHTSTAQIVATLQASLSTQGKAIFDRMVKAGADSFAAVTAAGNNAFVSIASGLSNQLLPSAAATFALLESIGISSADAIKAAFAGLSSLGASFPGGNSGAPQFFQTGGKLVFGSFQGGAFQPAPAPPTTGPEQVKLRQTAPSFDIGGVVPGTIGAPVLATVHGGETVVPTGVKTFADVLRDAGAGGDSSGLQAEIRELSSAVRGFDARPQVHVVPVINRDELPLTLYRLQRENRYLIPTGTGAADKPIGVR